MEDAQRCDNTWLPWRLNSGGPFTPRCGCRTDRDLHGVTRLRIPAPTTLSRAPRATTIGANVVAAVLVVIGAALAPKMPVPATVLCFTGALLILDLTGFLPIAVPARSRCKVIDLARARRARMRASVT